MFLANSSTVFAWDPVLNTSLNALITNQKSISAIALDYARLYLYVSDYDGSAATVNRYQLVTNYSDATNPKVSVNSSLTKQIYKGKNVNGLEVDQFRHYVFVGDEGN